MDFYLTPYTKVNSKFVKNLISMRPETVQLEENIGEKLYDTEMGSDFLDVTSKVQVTKAKIEKWDYIPLKYFCTASKIIR